MTCKYSDNTTNKMKTLDKYLQKFHFGSPKKLIKFNWGTISRCKYGMTNCNKILTTKKEYSMLSDSLNNTLSSYIEHINEDDYFDSFHQILHLFSGTGMPYNQFEQEVRKARKEN